jgi:hypothetical protein
MHLISVMPGLWRKPFASDTINTMERHFIIALALALLIPQFPAWAEASSSPKEFPAIPKTEKEESIFAPFPTRIRVGIRKEGIVLTWADGATAVEGYAVYRSEKPIDHDSFSQALKLATLPNTAHEYLDAAAPSTPFYYAVLGLSAEGAVYEVFIPLKNVSIAPVAIASAEPVVETPPPVEPPPAISVESFKDAIRITWTAVREGRRINVYRSTSQIRSLSDLLNASWVAAVDGPDSGLADYPVPGIDYYYALVDDDGLRNGNPILEKGKNTTTEPVSVPVGLYRVGLPSVPAASRSLPLPYLALTKSVEAGGADIPGGFSIPTPAQLQPDTEKALKAILTHGTPRPDAAGKLMIFPRDTEGAASGGEEYTLHLIVSERLAKQDWTGAADELARYLSLNRSPAVAARAHFYRGEALAFSGLYRDSFFEFLQAQDSYYVESNRWIDWLLDKLPEHDGEGPR